MADYCQVYGVIHFTSPAGWLPVHRDQLWAQRSVTSMGKLYLLPFYCCSNLRKSSVNSRDLSGWVCGSRNMNSTTQIPDSSWSCCTQLSSYSVYARRMYTWHTIIRYLNFKFHKVVQQQSNTLTHDRLTALSGTTRAGQYKKKHSPTHTHPDHQTSFYQLPPFTMVQSVAFSLINLRAWQSFPQPIWSTIH